MPRDSALPQDHPHLPTPKIGVLLVNLGTPEATTYRAMRRYLSEFLSDRRVIEVNPLLWQPLLQGIILTFRPRRSARAYRRIWEADGDESPLRRITREQAKKLSQRVGNWQPDLVVDWAMRYGQPSIGDRMAALQAQGCTKILILALYPQYCAATTATAYDAAFRAARTMRWQPALRTAAPYHDHPAYIDALASSLKPRLATRDRLPGRIVVSFHGLPKAYFDKGDPYPCQCRKTVRLLAERLGPQVREKLLLTFQSRFGRAEWLQPYTAATLARLPAEGVDDVMVIAPGFSADCVETLEELAIGGKEIFLGAGGKHYEFVPCLNDSDQAIDLIESLLHRDLAGWSRPGVDAPTDTRPTGAASS